MARRNLAAGCCAAVMAFRVAAAFAGADPAAPASPPAPCTAEGAKILHVAKDGTTAAGALGDRITIAVRNLSCWAVDNDIKLLSPVLDGRALKGLNGDVVDLEKGLIKYDLKRLPDKNGEAWSALLSQCGRRCELPISVGYDGRAPVQSDAVFVLTVFPRSWSLIALLIVALFAVFIWLSIRSDILRDPGPEPARGDRRYFSLARTQMAWWFFLALAAFLYIGMVTGSYDTITTGVLTLIGISGATGLAAVAVDSNKRSQNASQRISLQSELTGVETRIVQIADSLQANPAPANADDLKKELAANKARAAEIETTLAALPKPALPKSQGFLRDLVQDETGVSFHRFQMVAWTVILGVVFVRSVTRDLAMPEFNTTLLGLMGISSGTYIGFKFPNTGQ